MINQKLAFIGGGNMANAIIGGLLTAGFVASNIIVSDPYPPSRDNLEKNFNVKTTDDNNITVTAPNTVLILAVKPQVMKSVAEGIAKMVQTHKPLIITIAAGITLPDLSRWLLKDSIDNHPPSLIRCMPNTPALVGQGATGLYAEAGVTESQKNIAFTILKSVSKSTYWVDKESLLDVVTGVSGSGPAYFFLMVEALEQAGIDLGLPADVARGLAAQTCLGAGSMLTTSTDSPAELRRKVTSPNGTTEAAVKSLEAGGVRELFANAVKAATNRGEELGRILGSQVEDNV
ncbi:pyrroline-5-carboxylate reductase [Globomyces pollinis-pini]|nr:pyrroline-5-carboxylate reductase [Globomyces pollinis-pini]